MTISFDEKKLLRVYVENLPEDLAKKILGRFHADKSNEKWQHLWLGICMAHVSCKKPTMFIQIKDKALIGAKEFNSAYNRIVNLQPKLRAKYRDNAAAFATQDLRMDQANKATYEPGRDDWNGTAFNMWKKPPITPLAEKPKLFLAHVDYLIPDERERELLLNWLAWAVQKPMEKLQFALLLVGRKGTGKSWFSKLMPVLFGPENALIIPQASRAESKFNADVANRQMMFVDEMLPNGSNKLQAVIEPMITGVQVDIEPKGVDKFQVPNHFNIMAVTNYDNAMKVQRDTRRWGIVRTIDDLATDDYYDALHAITPDDGSITKEARRILWFLQRRDLSGFNGRGQAPKTGAKDDMAEATESDTETIVRGLAENNHGPFRFCLFTVGEVASYIPRHPFDKRREKQIEAEVIPVLKDLGCRRLDHNQIDLPKPYRRGRLWAANRTVFEQSKAQTAEELRNLYVDDRALCSDPLPPQSRITDFDED